MRTDSIRIAPAAVALLAGASLTGCLAYNEECSRFMTDPEGIAGWLAGEVRITKPEVRTRDNAIGQLVAESYFHAFDAESERFRPDLAVVNSGAIRADGVCEPRDALKKGPVKRRQLRDVLPFDNKVVVVSMSHRQLKNVFEHSLAGYSQIDPKGAYLQVYGAEVWASCALDPEVLATDGTRQSEGKRVTRIVLHRRDGAAREVPLDPPSDVEKVRVAVDSFLQGGGDGFLDLKALDPAATDTISAGSFGFEIVAKHFAAAYPEVTPLAAEAEPRVHLEACR